MMPRTLDALALLDRSTPQQLADYTLTYRGLALAAIDSLAEAYTRVQILEALLEMERSERRRLTSAAFPQIVAEAQ